MAYRYIGKWAGSPHGDSPTLWQHEETGEYFMQGYRVDEALVRDELLPAAGKDAVPPGETLIRFPADMAEFFREADGGADAG
ncbi:hypothetical protein E1264_18365 [Actinomadura sp. KC216]|uniref:hypothetical protein n=1 Tax=Actinomadura sp. KC216 TaxID=2530370 RepID=UPI00104BE3FD|nr:hypothetical protein [Actinomadura sp. KC216]TDB86260.1 hypothetical protein E1264_18365 [Actinomadura sp. KC216]